MDIIKTGLNGVFEIHNKAFHDNRGSFVKTFHKDTFKEAGLATNFEESFYSTSKLNVIRGMHFQTPPNAHVKLVYVPIGEILDVVVDIRKDSDSYGKFYYTTLSQDNAKSLYIPEGFAHGFLTKSPITTVVYMTTAVHAPESDMGIHWDSFGFDWPISEPIVSDRDNKLPKLI